MIIKFLFSILFFFCGWTYKRFAWLRGCTSRFGKFVEIQFDKIGKISGAAVRTYLLERSRVCQVSDPERNYHCFYMLCSAPPEVKFRESNLDTKQHTNLLYFLPYWTIQLFDRIWRNTNLEIQDRFTIWIKQTVMK